jgi:endogenous inhibitor of DNA gyrase (YacG/DUF329 family)
MAVDQPVFQPARANCAWCGARIWPKGMCSCKRHCSTECHNADQKSWDEGKKTETEGDEPPTCPVCGKAFKNEFGLRGHMRTHEG